MTARRSRTTFAAAAILAAAALVVPAAANATGTSPAAVPQAQPTSAPAAPTTVVLPTGDRVAVRTVGGRTNTTVTPSTSDAFANFDDGHGDHYVIPSEAAPYAGRVLDLSLFNVAKLAAAPQDPNAHIPVQLSFHAGVTPAAPPGVTFTSVSGQSAVGYLTPDSGAAFAQALRDQIKADLAAGRKAGSGGLFGGLASMAELGASTPVQPYYPLHILQMNTVGDDGTPSDADILLVNVDNTVSFTAQTYSFQGVARVAVPAGNYAAYEIDFAFDPQAHTVKEGLVTLEGISVPATGPVPAVTLDARTATSQLAVTTQQSATQDGQIVTLFRQGAAGFPVVVGLVGFGPGMTFSATPTPKPQVGTFGYAVNWIADGPASATPYRYNLGWTTDHIPANQTYSVADSSLASVQHTIDSDPAYGSQHPLFGSGFVFEGGYNLVGTTLPASQLTEYVTAGLAWLSELASPFVFQPGQPFIPPTFMDSDPVVYAAGQSAARTWAQAPINPRFGRHAALTVNPYGCQACVGGGNMDLILSPVGDSNPDSVGIDFAANYSEQVYWNGQQLLAAPGLGAIVRNIQPGPATIRYVLDVDRSHSGISQATATHNDVTIPYSGQPDPSSTLPSTTFCVAADVTGTNPPPPCQILPALTLDYQLNALNSTNTSHSPMQNLVLRVGHLSYGGFGSTAGITSAQVSVSFDGGTTWQDVPTHGNNGNYDAHWANPAAGSPVMLRVTATDCLGGSITQTITSPYTVG